MELLKETFVVPALFVLLVGAGSRLFAQEVIEPRPIPELATEQRDIQEFVQPRNHCVPVYPKPLADLGQEGWVLLELTISTTGEPVSPRVFDASPPEIFNEAGLEAVSKCRFEPPLSMENQSKSKV